METASLSFGEPTWFFALVLLPIAILLLCLASLRKKRLLKKLVAPRLVGELVRAIGRRRYYIRIIFLLSTLTLLIVTLAKPRLGVSQVNTVQLGRDIIIAIDVSQSMLATDSSPNRITRAKLFVKDCIHLLHGDRLGLISFAGTAFLQIPLTTDYDSVVSLIEELDTNFIPRGGTNIASAIRTAKETFRKFDGSTRALILVSDGEELEETAITEAKKAASQGIRIYTVGIGSMKGAFLPTITEEGQPDFVRGIDGKPVISRLDAACLKEISEATGGFYCPLSPFAAQQIVRHCVRSLTERTGKPLISSRPKERFEWTLIPSICSLLAWWLAGEQQRMGTFHSRRVFLYLVLLGIVSSGTLRAAQSGLENYQKGDYPAALKAFESYLQKRPNLSEAAFNAGTAAYKLRAYDKALDYFGRATLGKSNSLRVSSKYNIGNSLVRKGEASLSTDQKRVQWQAAIRQYDEVLQQDPKRKSAADNKKLVQAMLKALDQQQGQKEPPSQGQKEPPSQGQKEPPSQGQKAFGIRGKGGMDGMKEKTSMTHSSVLITKEQADALIDSMKEEEEHLVPVPRQEESTQQDTYKNW